MIRSDAVAVGAFGELLVADDVTLDASGELDMQVFRFGSGSEIDVDVPQRHAELLRDIAKPGVRFLQETITAIDPGTRQVTTDAGGP